MYFLWGPLGLLCFLSLVTRNVKAFSAHSSQISINGPNVEQVTYTSAFPSNFELGTPLVPGVSIGRYNPKREYSPELARIYTQYLANDMTAGAMCAKHNLAPMKQAASITEADVSEAIDFASQQIQLYETANQQYLAIDPRGLNFSAYIFGALLQARFNEFITQYLTTR